MLRSEGTCVSKKYLTGPLLKVSGNVYQLGPLSEKFLIFLPCRTEKNFVDVHRFRLAHGVGDSLSERFGGDRDVFIEVPNAFGDVRLGYAVRELGHKNNQ